MECPECHTDNPDSRKFCRECGNKLFVICPVCSFENVPGDKFCGECGHQLNEITKNKEESPTILSERKNVTVLFSDMSGYTAMTERLDPEDVKDLMSRIFGEIAQVITKYEGFIERFIGDAVMAIFGVPKAHEDDPIRAIRAAREIHNLVEALSPNIEEKTGKKIGMHSGINTGLVVTGEVNVRKGTHGITGDPVNLASRLEGLAKEGEIIVGEQTFRQAEGYFIFERLKPRKVKGKESEINVYRVIAPSTRRTRFDVSSERGLTPLVGRKEEVNNLLDGFYRATKGHGQAFTIVSDAGLGKSRLLYEFRKAMANENATFLEGKCLSYSKSMAYHPIIDILKSNFDIQENDSDIKIKDKVINGLKSMDVDELTTLPYLLELLSVSDEHIDHANISPEDMKDRIIEALKLISVKGSEIRPLIMAIEDLHWIDKSSEDAIKELVNVLPGSRIFLILTYRHEFVPRWGVKSYLHQINLNRFVHQESISMIGRILDTEEIDPDLYKLIINKTEGIPFFIEEIVKYFTEAKLIERKDKYYLSKDVQNISIPATIHDVLMARIDSLPIGSKEVLQTGSVIEREFSYQLLKKIIDISENELLSQLSFLNETELIYERGVYPQSTYVFKHALTRDVIYSSILLKKKKIFHQKAGQAIEELFQDNISEYYGILVNHFVEAEIYEKAEQYAKLAGINADRAGSHQESVFFANKRIFCLENLPQTKKNQNKIIDMRTILGLRMIDVNSFHKAQEVISPIQELALKGEYKNRASMINTIIGTCECCINEDFQMAFQFLEEAIRIADKNKDIGSLASASYWIGYAFGLDCNFKKAHYYIDQCYQLNVAIKHGSRAAIMKGLISVLAYYYSGRIKQAFITSQEAITISEQTGDIFSKAFVYAIHGLSCYGMGYFNDAIQYSSMGAEYADKIGQHYWNQASHHILGEIYYQKNDYSKARQHFETAIEYLTQHKNLPGLLHLNKLALTRILSDQNHNSINFEHFYEIESTNRVKSFEGWMAKYLAEILMNSNSQYFVEAENWINKAIVADTKNKMMFHLGRDYVLYYQWLKKKKDRIGAIKNLKKAINIFKDCGSDGWVELHTKELAAFSE